MYYAYIVYKNKTDIRESGIVESWEECKEKIYKRPAKFKKFGRLDDAEEFIRENGARGKCCVRIVNTVEL